MRRALWASRIPPAALAAIVLCSLGLASRATAQQDDEDAPSTRLLQSEHFGVTVRCPEGWEIAPVTDGVLLALRPVEDTEGSRIELRVSPRVPPQHRTVYVKAFVEGLKEAYQVIKEPVVQVHGSREGRELVMASRNPMGGRDELVVFFFFRRNMAYVLIALSKTDLRSATYEVFADIVQSLVLEDPHD